jgi:adenylosuccinate synthase
LGSTILCEAAQGFALDIDMGIYPFVTSSNTTIGAVMTGLGISYAQIRRVIGVIKAYNTKVGTGPFITQTNEEIGNKIREVGNEYGATTGRPRKIGWLDLPQIRQAIRVNGVTEIIMTKLDVLYCIDKILVCDAYIDGAKILEYAPSSPKKYETMIPCYRHYDSWEKIECTEDSLNAIHFVNFYNFKDNPKKQNLRIFINDIINLLQIPIRFISVGTRNRDIISFFSNTELTQTILTGTSLCIDSEIPYTRDKTIYSSFIPRAQTWHTVDKTEAKNDKNKSESKAL